MKELIFSLVIVVATIPCALGQTTSGAAVKSGGDKITSELQDLHRQVREAVTRRDRATLERLYADEFMIVHTTGSIDTKAEHIRKSLTTDVASPLSAPAQDQIHLNFYGDVVVRTVRSKAGEERFLWWTWVYVKRDGRWQIARQHGTPVPPERTEIKLDPRIYDAYVGKYEYPSGSFFIVTKEGGTLLGQGTGRPQVILVPESRTQFHVKGGDATFTFHQDDKGQVTHLTMRRGNGQEQRANKIQ